MKVLLPLLLFPALTTAQAPATGTPLGYAPTSFSAIQRVAYEKAADALEHFFKAQVPGDPSYGAKGILTPKIEDEFESLSELDPAIPKPGDLASADADLNIAYRNLANALSQTPNIFPPGLTSGTLRDDELAWIGYRDAMTAFGSTLSPALPAAWQLWLTRLRTDYLKSDLNNALAKITKLSLTFSGRIIRADNGKPLEGATVILSPCVVCPDSFAQMPKHDPVKTTTADGGYQFTDIPWKECSIDAAHAGFAPEFERCGTGNIKMKTTTIPTAMSDRALAAVYGALRPDLDFRAAAFSPDGNVLQILVFPFRADNKDSDKTSWKYDLRTRKLEPGPMISEETGSDTLKVGAYFVTLGKECRDCGYTIVASSHEDRKELIRITENGAESGFVGSSDGKVILWYDGQAVNLFDLNARRATLTSVPNSDRFEPLAARPDGDGYLFAYEIEGPCNIDGPTLIEKVESDQDEKIARNEENAMVRRAEHICFVHVRSPID